MLILIGLIILIIVVIGLFIEAIQLPTETEYEEDFFNENK
jgi:uncharacterized membrane protein